MKIGVISDTHSHMDEGILGYLKGCDEIWHAGDIGEAEVLEQLSTVAPLVAVYGNIDDRKKEFLHLPEALYRVREGCKIGMIHIAGKLPKYEPKVLNFIKKESPAILIAGHSHILKVQFDKINNCLYVNPGAAGHHGFHTVRTLIRFEIKLGKPTNMEVIELGKRGRL